MTASIFKGSFVKTNGAAPHSQSITGVGFQPVALILWSSATHNGTRTDARFAIGFSTATASYAVTCISDDAFATSNTSRHQSNYAISLNTPSKAIFAAATLSSMDADGFTLSWDPNGTTSTYDIHYLAFGGVSAAVSEWNTPTVAGTQAVTGVGFTPDVVFHIYNGLWDTTVPVFANDAGAGLGAMTTTEQWAKWLLAIDNQAIADTGGAQVTNAAIHTRGSGGSASTVELNAAYSSMDADGFTVNFTDVVATANKIGSLSIAGLTNVKLNSFNKDTAAAPASQTVTGVGFTPSAVLLASSQTTAASPHDNAAIGLGAATAAAEAGAISNFDEDANTTTHADGRDDDSNAFIVVNNNSSTIDALASFTAFTSDGFTLSWDTNDANAVPILYAAFDTTSVASAVRVIAGKLMVDWDMDGVYTDESSYLIQASGSMRLNNPADSISSGRGIADSASIVLDNASGRFSPLNTSSPITASIADGEAYHVPMYLSVSIDDSATFSRVFTGILKIPSEIGATSRQHPQITLDCRSWDEAILQQRISTLATTFAGIYDDGKNESEIIAQWLTDSGMTDGTEFVSQEYAAAHSVTATLDPGFFNIPWAWLDEESAIVDCWQLAAAAGGRFYCDPEGSFRYENAGHWILSPHDTIQAALTKADFVTLQPWYEDAELFKAVDVEIAPRELLDTSVVWHSDIVEVIPPATTREIIAKYRQPVYALTTPVAVTDYVAITSGGVDLTSDVTITISALNTYAQRLTLSVANANTSHAANLVIFQIRGQAVDGARRISETRESTNSFWIQGARTNWARTGRTRNVRSNPYIQSTAQGAMLAEFLRDRYETPRLFFKISGVSGIADRRLGDRISITDADVMTASHEMFVFEIGWHLSRDGFSQNYVGVDAADLYPYSDTTPGYFIIGTSTLDAVASDRAFY